MAVPGPDLKPCGACAELVPAEEGCVHWKPQARSGKRVGWVRGRSRGTTASLPADSPDIAQRTIAVLTAGGLTAR